jgi:hypothetical protein
MNSPKSSSIRQSGPCDRMGVVSRRIFQLQYPLAGCQGAVTGRTTSCDRSHVQHHVCQPYARRHIAGPSLAAYCYSTDWPFLAKSATVFLHGMSLRF